MNNRKPFYSKNKCFFESFWNHFRVVLFLEGAKLKECLIDNKQELGTCTCTNVGDASSATIDIGAKDEMLSQPLKGAISTLEIYTTTQALENGVPDKLKHLIVSSQLIEIKDENEEPPEKKKKIQPINE